MALWYSSITGNTAHADPVGHGQGGEAFAAEGSMHVLGSTVDHNAAARGSGLVFGGGTTITNTTVCDNVATLTASIYSKDGSLTIENSTIALNHDVSDQSLGSVFFRGVSAGSMLTLQSSIIAANTSGPNDVPTDLYVFPGLGALVGASNLVISSNIWPPGVVVANSDPELGPLQFNGGFTLTRVPGPNSPALGLGNNNAGQESDERGHGYPRTTGAGPNMRVDIGAVQFDSIFFGGFEFTN
jgi:hypothetical protein